jgi:hypothetical protein
VKLSEDDKRMLRELCEQQKVSYDKVIKLLETVKEFEFRDRRTGVYEALRDVIRSASKPQ